MNNIWYFGDSVGLDFNAGLNPTPLSNSKMWAGEGCASSCDYAGNVIFYTNGEQVWNKNHQVMPNGSGLNGSYSSTQSGLVVPKPNSPNEFFIFTSDYEGRSEGLQYSIVDMTLDNGLGDITQKNIQLVTPVTENLTAIKHGNTVDYWLITHKWNSNEFYSYLVTQNGVQQPVVSAAGGVHNGLVGNAIGQLKVSPNGNQIAIINRNQDAVEMFTFDNNSGIIGNPYSLTGFSSPGLYGLEFSAKARRLYVTAYSGFANQSHLYQFDLEAGSPAAINNSLTTIADFAEVYIGALQIGPNAKIYLSRRSTPYVGVINDPENIGLACNFDPQGVTLVRNCWMGLPAFVQSDFYTSREEKKRQMGLNVYPNPSNSVVNVSVKKSGEYEVSLMNSMGQTLASKPLILDTAFEVNKLTPGVYFIEIAGVDGKVVEKLVVR